MDLLDDKELVKRFVELLQNKIIETTGSQSAEEITEKWNNFIYFANNADKIFSYADIEIAKYGWVTTKSISYKDYQDIVFSINKGANQEQIDEKFINLYFSEDFYGLKDCLENIKINLEAKEGNNLRFSIIKDCFNIVISASDSKSSSFNLAIPVLLVHIEKLKDDLVDYIKDLFPDDFVLKEKEAKPKKKVIEAEAFKKLKDKAQFYKHSVDYIMDKVFENYYRVEAVGIDISESDILNRHQILHGDILKYGTKENFLRCCLVLELLSSFFNEEEFKLEENE